MKTSVVVVSKDEPTLGDTLDALRAYQGADGLLDEVVVVDASEGRLDDVRRSHPEVVWRDYVQPAGIGVTISHQRNIGVATATGDVVVFTDSGCVFDESWLPRLLAPLREEGESVTCGPARARESSVYSGARWWGSTQEKYVPACSTINLAFTRAAFDAVGGFDETFGAGEDLDFSWRLVDRGYQLRWVADAVVRHEWGDLRRQLRRSYLYGIGWVRLYRKHPSRIPAGIRSNPVPLVYPLYLLGLPLTLRYRAYPLLLLLPLWRSRKEELPMRVVVDHLVLGVGVLAELGRMGGGASARRRAHP
ncbi:MAG: glycosyltransferase [Actinomycetota bacterium]|nr:glycosyltransferase [Actinomycetota bacterium]